MNPPDDCCQSNEAHEGVDQFELHTCHHQAWNCKASDLHAAAGALWLAQDPKRDAELVRELGLGGGFRMGAALPSVYMMLWGLAFELGIKSIIVAKGCQPKLTHRLVDLAKYASIPFTARENELLDFLSECVIWEGKYPAPKERQDFEKYRSLHIDLFWEHAADPLAPNVPNNAHSWNEINVVWKKVQARYWELAEKRHD